MQEQQLQLPGSQSVGLGLTDTNQVKAYYNVTAAPTNFPIGSVTGAGNNTTAEIISYSLAQNFPNPFNPETQIAFLDCKRRISQSYLYDILGKQVATLFNQYRTAGTYKIELNADNYKMSTGIYYYKIESTDLLIPKNDFG